MMRALFPYLFVVVACVACHNNTRHASQATAPLNEAENRYDSFADVVSDYDWISLERGDNCMVGSVDKLMFHGDNYYVLDKFRQSKILVFGKDGRFLRSIGTKGRGYGEYLSITDVALDTENDEMIILSSGNRILRYDLDGQFKGMKDLGEENYSSIAKHGSGYICATGYCSYTTGPKAKLFTIYDADFREKARCVDVLPFQIMIPSNVSSLFAVVSASLTYTDVPLNRMFVFEDNADSVTHRIVEFGLKNPMPAECFQDVQTFNANFAQYDFIQDCACTKEVIALSYVSDSHTNLRLLDSKDYHTIAEVGQCHIPQMYYCNEDEWIYSPVSPDEYLELWAEDMPVQSGKAVNADDNILLLKWKF